MANRDRPTIQKIEASAKQIREKDPKASRSQAGLQAIREAQNNVYRRDES